MKFEKKDLCALRLNLLRKNKITMKIYILLYQLNHVFQKYIKKGLHDTKIV